MDQHNIFESYEKCKKIVNQLKLQDISYTKKIVNNIDDYDLKKVIETQYLFMFQKQCNIEHTKSLNIIQLEERLKELETKSALEMIKYINKLGYIDILLILLNLNVNKVLEIKKNMNLERKMYGGINIENIENIVNKTVGKIMEQIMDSKNSNLDTTTEESILEEEKENIIENIKEKFIGGKMEEKTEEESEEEAEEAEEEADIDDGNIYSKFIKEKEHEENTLYTVEVKKEGITEERRLTKRDEDLLKQIESDEEDNTDDKDNTNNEDEDLDNDDETNDF
tara:strand:+ start:53 stop:895 length:843 start_codon:yes stop_codon:yes gene_type:complete